MNTNSYSLKHLYFMDAFDDSDIDILCHKMK